MTMYYYIKWLITNDTLQFNSFYQALYHKEEGWVQTQVHASLVHRPPPPPPPRGESWYTVTNV